MTKAEMKLIRGLLVHLATASQNGARMVDPQPGDLVVETSSFDVDPDGIGTLLRIEGGKHGRWVIEPWSAPGTEQGWQNADFMAVPEHIAESAMAHRESVPEEDQ